MQGKTAEQFFVITGGPGSGKSTLIDALAAEGCARSIEAGRSIIQDQVAIGGRALAWRHFETCVDSGSSYQRHE